NGPRGVAFSLTGDTAYVCSFNASKVWRFVRGGTAVDDDIAGIPVTYSLSQNYPNPFNPTTQINFALPAEGMTTLKVFDVLGREVAELLHSRMAAGHHTVTFDASLLPSGMYIYKLETGDKVFAKKMMLLK
ncbi:T9SS type A sorting domain-containing protein, partial [bacterium]|nr:T9SS type A sorting domain-containing protein [bacterium]